MNARVEFRRGWPVVLAATLGIACGLAPIGTTYTLGPLSTALSAEFGWTRGQVMFATIAATIGLLPSSLFIGAIADQMGVKRIVLISQLGLGLAFAGLALTPGRLPVFYLLYALMGLIAAGTLPITFTKSISGWFSQARGLALGVALAGTGLAGFVAPTLTAWMVAAHGWRSAYLALAALPLVIGVPAVALFFRDPPRENDTASPPPLALRGGAFPVTTSFWILAACFLPISLCMTGIITNLVPILGDHGLPPLRAAGLAGAVGLSVVAGRVGVGWLVDRFWAPAVGAVFLSAPAAAALILALPSAPFAALALAAVLVGVATGAEIDLNAYLVSRYFQKNAYSQVYSAQYVVIVIGAGVASPIFAALRDATGSFGLPLYAAAAAIVVCALGLLRLGPYPRGAPPTADQS